MEPPDKLHTSHHTYIHLVSDATGVTLQGLARACLSQFDNLRVTERFWPLVRSERQLDRILEDIELHPGPVFFTLVDEKLRRKLKRACTHMLVPCLPVLDPMIKTMAAYLGRPPRGIPGLQHALDDAYFARVDAMDFALSFDDGQHLDGLEEAEVVLVGVSRTSKTPTCVFLARRGIRAANIPYVPGLPFPERALALAAQPNGPLFVGLTEQPERLVQIRRSRLKAEQKALGNMPNSYLDLEKVTEEVAESRRFFAKKGWPVLDVTRRSVEETAAEIQILLQKRRNSHGEAP